MTDLIYDTGLGIAGTLDGEDAVVVVVGPGYLPDQAHADLSDITDEIARTDVTLSTDTTTPGVLRLDIDTDPVEVDLSGDTVVAGWILAVDGATDADRVLIRWAGDPGGIVPDPYPVLTPSGVLQVSQ